MAKTLFVIEAKKNISAGRAAQSVKIAMSDHSHVGQTNKTSADSCESVLARKPFQHVETNEQISLSNKFNEQTTPRNWPHR
jgi:hypothetical protein